MQLLEVVCIKLTSDSESTCFVTKLRNNMIEFEFKIIKLNIIEFLNIAFASIKTL